MSANGIDADDLAMLDAGFRAAMTTDAAPHQVDQALFELGWGELLGAAPAQGAGTAFLGLGATGAVAGLLDDVVGQALGLTPDPSRCVALPRPHRADAPGRLDPDTGDLLVDGLASTRIASAPTTIVAVAGDGGHEFVAVESSRLRAGDAHADPTESGGVDPGGAYQRIGARVPAEAVASTSDSNTVTGAWDHAVAAARVALAHQLVGAAGWMLDQARTHAVDRVQFGRAVASFQAVRHKLAESLVQIEGATSVAAASAADYDNRGVAGGDPLLAALAKSLAGKAALTTAAHAQQVLGGIGFTADHDFHRWLKRTLVIDTVFGSADSLPTEIGNELLARGDAPRLLDL